MSAENKYGDSIAKRIRNRRIELNLSQSQLAHALGVSTQAISLWENARTNPGGANMSALAKALKCSFYWLIDGGDNPEQEDEVDDFVDKKDRKFDLIYQHNLIYTHL